MANGKPHIAANSGLNSTIPHNKDVNINSSTIPDKGLVMMANDDNLCSRAVDLGDEIEFQRISKIRKKDRTPEQQKTFDRIRMKNRRNEETNEQKDKRCEMDRENKKKVRALQTVEKKVERCKKDREQKRMIRDQETEKQKYERCKKNREQMKIIRDLETEKQK